LRQEIWLVIRSSILILTSFLYATAWAEEPTSQPVAVEAEEEADDHDEDEAEPANGIDPELEAIPGANVPLDDTIRYTTDLTDQDLDKRFCGDLASLGSISVGFAESGRMIGAVKMSQDPAWTLVVPEYAWGTQETVDYLSAAARLVKAQFPDSVPLRVNHIGKKDGGYVRPHRSHQSGRDVDLGFFYKNDVGPGGLPRAREKLIDPARNWALIRAIVTQTDVQVILADRRIQNVLYEHALAQGEDKEWLDSLFHAGTASLVQHARRHRDHFHVRFFSPRSQELGRRVQPLLAKRPDENKVSHRVRSGETLGHIARKYGSSVRMIQRANGMRSTFLKLGRSLTVPMRGPCTQCPLPPAVVVPARRLPPQLKTAVVTPEPTLTTASH
jgi:LysM repeat protein